MVRQPYLLLTLLCSLLLALSTPFTFPQVLDEADLLLTGAVAEPILGYLIPNLRSDPFRKPVQFVFCAATVPGRGRKSVSTLNVKHFYSACQTLLISPRH